MGQSERREGPVSGLVWQFVVPKHVLIQIPGTYSYVTSQDKREFADVIKVKDPEMERLSWISQCPNIIT